MKTQHTLHFPLFPSIMTSLAKERIDLMQMIIMIAMLSVIFGLTGTYAFCKSGSMIEFFGGNKKNEKNEDYPDFNFRGNWRMQCHDEPHDFYGDDSPDCVIPHF